MIDFFKKAFKKKICVNNWKRALFQFTTWNKEVQE
jgi:hypothetical protein